MGLGSEEIAKVKAEWEERQARKKAKEKEKKKEQEKDEDKGKEDKEGKSTESRKDAATLDSERKSTLSSPPATSATPQPTHQRYSLHRDIFAMRLAEHRKRRQTAQAKELAPRLPHPPNAPLP